MSAHPEPPPVAAVLERLTAPFPASQVKWRPGATSGNRAMALAYLDARAIQDRLDEVLGPACWQDEYEALPNGTFLCRLRLRLGAEWVTKMDVGGQSEQDDEGDRCKAAVSDALKRAAVKFGVGRYLYRLPVQWVDFDPKKRQFTARPTLPPEALPRAAAAPPARPAVAAPGPKAPREAVAAKNGPGLPADGAELRRRLYDYDARLARQGVCAPGALVKHVAEAGVGAGFERDLATWSGPAILLAVEETKGFETKARKEAKAREANRKARAAKLRPLLARLGFDWGAVCDELGKPHTTGLSELTDAEFAGVVATLERQAREAPPAK